MIRRGARRTNYTIMSNVGLNDDRLSFKAKGLLAYLLSKPDHWEVREAQLASAGPDGRDAVSTGLKELEDRGYLLRTRERDEKGRFVWISVIHDEPVEQEPLPSFPGVEIPASVNPASVNPASVKPPLVITDVVRTDSVKTEEVKTEAAAAAAAGAGELTMEEVKALSVLMDRIGIVGGAFFRDQVFDLAREHGYAAARYGLTEAAQNGAANSMRYINKAALTYVSGGSAPKRGASRGPDGTRVLPGGEVVSQEQYEARMAQLKLLKQNRGNPVYDQALLERQIEEYERRLGLR